MRPVAIFQPPAPPAAAILAKAPAFSGGIFGFLGRNLKNPSTMKMYVQFAGLQAYKLKSKCLKSVIGRGKDENGTGSGDPIMPPPPPPITNSLLLTDFIKEI